MPTPKGAKTWNAGTSQGWTDKRGYRWLYVNENGRRVARREHRVVVERHMSRKLEPWELVHHKDGNKANNAVENLEVMEFGEHTAAHHSGGRKSEDARRSMEAFALMREEMKRVREINSDLLEALREAKAVVDAAMMTDDPDGPPSADQDVLVAMRGKIDASIAKATGEAV